MLGCVELGGRPEKNRNGGTDQGVGLVQLALRDPPAVGVFDRQPERSELAAGDGERDGYGGGHGSNPSGDEKSVGIPNGGPTSTAKAHYIPTGIRIVPVTDFSHA